MLRTAFLVALALVAPGCMRRDVSVRFAVTAKTNQGEPVGGAVIAIDGKALGETNNTGSFQTEIKLPAGSESRLEVKKDSDTYYFAPYYESLKMTEAPSQEFEIGATLYFVPKPKGDDKPEVAAAAASVAEAEVAEAPASEVVAAQPEEAIPEAPPVSQDAKDAAADLKDIPAEEDQVAVAPPVATSEQNQAKIDAAIASANLDAENTEADIPAEEPAALPAPAVSTAEIVDFAPEMKPGAYPKPNRPNRGPLTYTIHVLTGGTPVEGADVAVGQDEDGDLKVACTTNQRGRCVIRFPVKPKGEVTFVATRKGFKTKSVVAEVKDQGLARVDLEHGQTIDVYAITKSYNYAIGLPDVEVFVDGKQIGVTDRFGRLSYVHGGKPDDMIGITLKPRNYLPETFETDFVASGPMKLVKYFAPLAPPPVKMTILDLRPAGSVDKAALAQITGTTDPAVQAAAKQYLFAAAAFKEFPRAMYEAAVTRTGKTGAEVLTKGWQDTDLKAKVDALILPTVVAGATPLLELSAIDSKGKVLAAAEEELGSLADKASIDRAVELLAKKLARAFPFEGAVLSKEGDKVTVNIGYAQGRGLKPGDVLEVFGVQSGKHGLSQMHKKIAQVTIKSVNDTTAVGNVDKLAPRAAIERGDLVALRTRRAPAAGAAEVRVMSDKAPLAQANVYFNDHWIGATDEAGRLYLDVTGGGQIKVIKHGFQAYRQSVTLTNTSKVDVGLKQETAFLKIDSQPPLATVKIDGKVIGKTPLSEPIPVPSGFVKIEIEGPAGYKPHVAVMELDEGTLDLSGRNTVQLERDLRGLARQAMKTGNVDKALALYADIPKEHSDYLLARHEMGEIYLTIKDQPGKAAELFAEVTADEGVKAFNDKRFIGSHVNEGVSLFLAAEKLEHGHPEEAKAHYRKAMEVFDRVIPQLRFVPKDQYAQAVHNVDFHRALARHKLWLFTQDPALLVDTVKTWRNYLDGNAQSVPADETSKAYVENARIYLRQASVALDGKPKAM